MACDAQALKQLNEDEEAEFEREELAQQAEVLNNLYLFLLKFNFICPASSVG